MKAPLPLAVSRSQPFSLSTLRSAASRFGYLTLFLLPVLPLLPNLDGFPFPAYSKFYSDLTITHFPNAFYLKQALMTWRSLPLWSPTMLSGYPFAANPLAGIWYPPGWLVLLLPLPLAFNLLIVIHLIWGGVGFYRLLRSEGISFPSALLGGLAFEAMPKIFAHYGTGHVTLLYAVSWTPWLLLAGVIREEKSFEDNSQWWRASRWGWAAVIMALVFLADVRWALFAGVIWWAYALWRGSSRFHPVNGTKPLSVRRRLLQLAGLTFLAALLAAPLALPLAEYTRLSTRAELTVGDLSAYSLPWVRILGLIYPELGGFHEWMLYPGSVVLTLALLGMVWKETRTRGLFWLGLALLALLFALGDNLPFFGYVARLPGLELLRVPARALFLLGMGLVALAALSLDALLAGLSAAQTRRGRLALVSLLIFALLMPVLMMVSSVDVPSGFIWGALAVSIAAFWVLYGMQKSLFHRRLWLAGLFSLCLLELIGVDQSLYRVCSSQQVFANAQELMGYLAASPGIFRVYSPSYSLPQENAVRYGLELADGVDPLQLQSYARFMEKASGVHFEGYSVTLPPFEAGDPATANSAFLPRADLLGLLNVHFVAAEFDLDAPDFILRGRFGQTRLYQNRLAKPRAWVQPSNLPLGEAYSEVQAMDWSPNRIELQAVGPGLLVLSENAYPGWQVWVDGVRQTMLSPDAVLRGVELPPGKHQVVFIFRPVSLYLGLGLSALGVLFLVGVSILSVRRMPG